MQWNRFLKIKYSAYLLINIFTELNVYMYLQYDQNQMYTFLSIYHFTSIYVPKLLIVVYIYSFTPSKKNLTFLIN